MVTFPCTYCGEQVNPKQVGTFRKVTGWVEYRKASGGANAVHLKTELQEFAHKVCIEVAQLPFNSEKQESLF